MTKDEALKMAREIVASAHSPFDQNDRDEIINGAHDGSLLISVALAALKDGRAAGVAAERERCAIEIAALRQAITHPHGQIGVGDQVHKREGYLWPGVVRSVFTTTKGMVRYVVECTVPEVEGALHIYNGNQIERTSAAIRNAPAGGE